MRKVYLSIIYFFMMFFLTYGVSDQYLVEDNLTRIAQQSLDAIFGEK